MLGDVITVVKSLASIISWKRQLDEEKRGKFAGLCDKISNVLERVSSMSEDRRKLIDLCAELRMYVEPIREIADGAVDSDDINRLATELDTVCDAWKKLTASAEPGSHSYEGYVDQLAEG